MSKKNGSYGRQVGLSFFNLGASFVHCAHMSLKAVVCATNKKLIAAHKQFLEWKTLGCQLAKTTFGWALRHFTSCKRAITGTCATFTSQKTYARAIATTRVIDNKVYWKAHDDPCWKRACRKPPPIPRNNAPVKVLFNHDRDDTYR